MERIKSYYLTEHEIVVRYEDKKEARYELNPINLKNVIASLDKQIDFNVDTVDDELESMYNDLISKLIVCTGIELIIVLSVFLSFISGLMISFIAATVALVLWFGIMVKSIYPEVIKFMKLNKSTKINEGRQILAKEYNTLNKENKDQLLSAC